MTFLDRVKNAAFNRPIIALMIIVGSTLIASKSVIDASLGILELLGLRENTALTIARNTAQGTFLRDISRESYNRLFWGGSFVGRLKRNAGQYDLDQAWGKYSESVQDWSKDLLNNQAQIDAYFGREKLTQFSETIHIPFMQVHDSLVSLRYGKIRPDSSRLASIQDCIDALNVQVFFFLTDLNDAQAKQRGFH